MGRMKEEFMQMKMQEQSQEINTLTDIAEQYHNNNQNNNKMTKKTMQEKLKKQPEPIVETRKEALRRLYKRMV